MEQLTPEIARQKAEEAEQLTATWDAWWQTFEKQFGHSNKVDLKKALRLRRRARNASAEAEQVLDGIDPDVPF